MKNVSIEIQTTLFPNNDGSVENDRNWLYLKDFER